MNKWKSHKTIGVLAASIAVLGASTMGMASDALKEGVSFARLKAISNNTAEVLIEGRTLQIAGSIPKECAQGAHLESDYQDGRHNVKIRLAEKCEAEGYVPADGKRAFLSKLLTKELDDQTGAVVAVVMSRKSRDEASKFKVSSEEILADPGIKSKADAAAELEQKKFADIQSKIQDNCKHGNFVGLGEVIEANRKFLGELAGALKDEVVNLQIRKFERGLEKADSAKAAKAVFDKYLEVADSKGWDTEQLNEKYIEARNRLLHAEVKAVTKNVKRPLAPAAAGLSAWRSELASLDSARAESMDNAFAFEFKELGNAAVERESYAEGAEYLIEAADMSSDMAKAEPIRGQAVAAYIEAYKQCVKASPFKAESCDKKFREPAEKIAKKVSKDKERLAKKNDELAGDFMSFSQEYYQVFGYGGPTYQMGFGWSKQMPGSLDMFKYQTIAEAQQAAQMAQYQQVMQRMYGGANGMMGMAQAGTQKSGFFSLNP